MLPKGQPFFIHMRTLEKKQRIRRVIYSVPSLIVLLIITIFLVRGAFGVLIKDRERFNVTQEGEFVAVIVDDRGISTSTDDSMLPWYRKFLNVIISFYEY